MTDTGSPQEEYVEANRTHWEQLVADHPDIESAEPVAEFLSGDSKLLPVQHEELDSVEGKSLIDLQSHLGIRTLSWAREGATVTGVDISAESIAVARELAAEAGLADRAAFIQANVLDLPSEHDDRYDIVVTNFGVLCWLPDIDEWASVVAELLKPDGVFYLAEHHPIATALSDSLGADGDPIAIENPYFSTETPATQTDEPPHKWTHGLGEILTALIEAGIELEFIHEHSFSIIERSPEMVQAEDGTWHFESDIDIPLLVTVKGTRQPDSD
ncbi:class I SAM-dependent methyltransferase [Halorubrum sp. AD140]|uniref:class I SAM-dependent methyltransferase n=1 Tax=Halorubrum sp. AD140 TaxID=3050073 RepID=UPI002ACCCACC|nr:class I SAM-dependent methyltransferase [Halorubrum sp. AD140]MDZ5810786.1 class I SAM-dependent methyltransferase [Halorubrum sp. AD140]